MDIRNGKWWGQLQISGVGKVENHSGSVMGICAEVLKDLRSTSPRALASGEREIVIRIRDRPFSQSKESSDLDRVLDVSAELDESQTMDGPRNGESPQQFQRRLLDSGLSPAAAEMITADWFDAINQSPLTHDLQEWMNDPKAARFRLLNSSREAYESASPSEYAELKRYVLDSYPSFCKGLTFRQA